MDFATCELSLLASQDELAEQEKDGPQGAARPYLLISSRWHGEEKRLG